MTSLRCLLFRRRAGALEDGELGRSAAERVRAHLEVCPSCRAWRDGIHDIAADLAALRVEPSIEETGAVTRRVLAALPARGPAPRWAGFPSPRRLLLPAGAAAALAVALLLVRSGPPPPERATEMVFAPLRYRLVHHIDRTVAVLNTAGMVIVQIVNLSAGDETALTIVRQEIEITGLQEDVGDMEALYRGLPDPEVSDLLGRLRLVIVAAANTGAGDLPALQAEILSSGIMEEVGATVRELTEIGDWAAAQPV